jgi:hypothetical protein
MRQRSRPAVPDDAAVIENLLELGGGSTALLTAWSVDNFRFADDPSSENRIVGP